MKPLKLTVIPQEERNEISDIIGRGASEVLKRNVPEFQEERISFYNKGIKWAMSLVRIDKFR